MTGSPRPSLGRLILLSFTTFLVLGACGNEAESFDQPSALVSSMNEEGVGCSDVEEASPGDLANAHVRCTIEGDPVDIYVFSDESDLDRWLTVGAGLGDVVVGPNWTIDAGDHSQQVAEALHGEIR